MLAQQRCHSLKFGNRCGWFNAYHDIAEALNNSSGSPFFHKLRMLGTQDDWTTGGLSQATFCKHLMTLYSKDPQTDESKMLLGKSLTDYTDLPLRAAYLRSQFKHILETVWKFFYEIAQAWPEQWNDPTNKSILPKTTGYHAFIQILKAWLVANKGNLSVEKLRTALTSVKTKYKSPKFRFIRENYPAGNQGVVTLRDSLKGDLL
jgi:hypothetical protein